jgi:cation transport protein ChaC
VSGHRCVASAWLEQSDRAGDPGEGGIFPLTRERIASGWIREMAQRAGVPVRILSDEEIEASLAATLAAKPADGPIWVFAYGSLIWNPTIRWRERRIARVYGCHRRFCLRTTLGRGTPQRPGLMLGLDRGGSCRGVVYRLPDDGALEELRLLWRREMVTGAYRPRWLVARTGEGLVHAIAFLIERRHERYCCGLDNEQGIEMLATGEGPLGRACDYLYDTARHLRRLGIPDRHLERLAEQVRARRAELAAAQAG